MLMLLTAGLAAYSGARVIALGFGTATWHTLPFGLFYAAFIFFIDRSVLLTVRPTVATRGGQVKVKRRSPSVGIRIFIAVCAALLVGETVLLSFFAQAIEPKVQEIRQDRLGEVLRKWDAGEKIQEDRLIGDLADKAKGLENADGSVKTKTDEVNCQLTGLPDCRGGPGEIYDKKRDELTAAIGAAEKAKTARDTAQTTLTDFRTNRNTERAKFSAQTWDGLRDADDLLIREEGFWRLTVEDNSVKLWRIVLSLLLLGVDLAPLLFKKSLDRTDYSRQERATQWQGEIDEAVDSHQVWENAQARRRLAPDIAKKLARQSENSALVLNKTRLEMDTRVRREEIILEGEQRLRDLRIRYYVPDQRPTPILRPVDDAEVLVVHDPGPPSDPSVREQIVDQPDDPSVHAPDPLDETYPIDGQVPLGEDQSEDWSRTPMPGDDIQGDSHIEGLELNGRWQLVRHWSWANRGGFGDVWLGNDLKGVEAEVVVKLMAVQDRKDAARAAKEIRRLRHSWQREVKVAEKLNGVHAATRHVGRILDHGEFSHGGRSFLFIVSPRYRPGSLANYCALQVQRNLGWCLDIVDEVLGGMSHAARAGIVHHDLKPANIVLDGPSARIIDWGLARFLQRAGSNTTSLVTGSLFYVSPEQAAHSPGWDTPLADLFSIGGLLYFLISDHAPLEAQLEGGANVVLEYWRLLQSGVRPWPLAHFHPDLPVQVAELADRWLAYPREDRVPPGTDPSGALEVAHAELVLVRREVRRYNRMVVGRSSKTV